MTKLSLLTRLGNAAAVLFGAHGDITRHTQRCGCSRQTAYDHAHQVQDAVADAQLPGPSRAELLADNQRLRQENQQLWDWFDQRFECPKAQRRQFAVLAVVLGLSLQQTRALLAILSGKRRGRCPYEHLGLRLPSYDPWELLQRDPDELKQQLSSQGVAA